MKTCKNRNMRWRVVGCSSIAITLIVGIPFLINCAFISDQKLVETFLQEKDVLSYYTSILSLSLTIATFYLAFKQTTDRIVHTQNYNRMQDEFQRLRARVDSCFDVLHPIKIKQYRLIANTESGNYVYALTHDLEAYKLSARMAADITACDLALKREFVDESCAGELSGSLLSLTDECIKLADQHLEFYLRIITSDNKVSREDFTKQLEEFDKAIDNAKEKLNDLVKNRETFYGNCLLKISQSAPYKSKRTRGDQSTSA